MKKVSDLNVRVIDKGLFIPIARRIARDVHKVTYWSNTEKAFQTVKEFFGDGFDDIQRVESPWQDKDEVDLWVFPDVGYSYLQQELIDQGKIVWGARDADRIETSRGAFLDVLEKIGLEVPPHTVIKGITNLKDHLYELEDRWIKISRFRGDTETFHWRSLADDENRLNALAVKLGPFREEISFYVFEPIETTIEDGCDSWCIDGQFPSVVIHGQEKKDENYVGRFQRLDELPEEVRNVNYKIAPVLAAHQYRGFFSTEVRITDDGKAYFIDATCRSGSPPSQVMAEMIGNYTEIIWGGANGELIEPEDSAKFGVQGLVSVNGDRKEWRSIKVSDDLDRWLKCPYAVWNDDRLWFPPDPEAEGKDVGWLVGIGDTLAEAVRFLQRNVSLLPDGCTCNTNGLVDLVKELEKIEELQPESDNQSIPSPNQISDIIHS